MDELSRVIGNLEKSVKTIESDVREIKHQVEKLAEFKWRVIGVTSVITFALTLLAKGLIH